MNATGAPSVGLFSVSEIRIDQRRAMWDVEVRENLPNKGRGLFALRDFKEDEILFEEEPLVSCQFSWNALYKYEACEHCMKSLETAEEMARRLSGNPEIVLPHPECCSVKKELHTKCPQCQISYCSTKCLDKAWETYHKMLCLGPSHEDPEHPLNKLCETWRNIHYPPETATIMLLARMIATVKQASDRPSAIAAYSKFCKATVNEEEEIAHKLLGKEFQVQLDMLRTQLTEAMFFEELQQWFSPEGFRSLFALIGTNGQGIGTSSISVWVRSCDALDLPENERTKLDSFIDSLYEDLDKESGQFLNCEGSGLYSLQSSCNHSCDPNAEVTFPHNNATLAVRASQDIKAGEEVHISYLDCCQLGRSRHSRQKALRENYLFNCWCTKCLSEADDPDVTSEEEMDDEEEGDELEVEDSFS